MPSQTPSSRRIAIVGAGIAGLTTAIALQQKGFQPQVFEAVPELKPVGAGILLAMNATQVYRQLGLLRKIEQAGWAIEKMHLTDPNLKDLSSTDFGPLKEEFEVGTVAIHRGALQNCLLDALSPQVNLQQNRRLKGLQYKEGQVELLFNDGHPESFDLVIGADGIHSVVRQSLGWGKGIRSAGQACWRGIAPVALEELSKDHFYEAWGKGVRIGFGQVGPEETYWFAVVRENMIPQSYSAPPSWKHLFREFHPEVQRLLELTPEEATVRNDLEDLNHLTQWQQQGVVLIGDAAHATTPNMGQGACQAIEDAYVLADCLEKLDTDEALKTFEATRMPKARHVVKQSWRIGQMAHWTGGMSVALRNTLIRMVPQSTTQKAMRKILTLQKVR